MIALPEICQKRYIDQYGEKVCLIVDEAKQNKRKAQPKLGVYEKRIHKRYYSRRNEKRL